MKQDVKWLFGILLSLMLVLGLLPVMNTTAHATDFQIWVGGKQVTSSNMNNVLGDGTVTFTYNEREQNGTLTLKGANIRGDHEGAAIYTGSPLIIRVEKDSTVTESNRGIQIYKEFNRKTSLTIEGPGTLTTKGGSDGVYTTVPLTVNGTLNATDTNCGVYAVGDLSSITVNGTLNATGGAANESYVYEASIEDVGQATFCGALPGR